MKYRIKIAERFIGPLEVEEIVQLYRKARIQGNEECQQFPAGAWKHISDFPEIVSAIAKHLEEDNEKLDAVDAEFKAFDYSSSADEDIAGESIVDIELVEEKLKKDGEHDSADKDDQNVAEGGIQKTRIIKLNKPPAVEKTVVVKRDELIAETKKEEVKPEKVQEEEISPDEKTAMFDLNALQEVKEELVESIRELEQQKQEENALEQGKERDLAEAKAEKQKADVLEEKKKKKRSKKKKKMSPVLALVFLGLFYYLLTDKPAEVEIHPQYIKYVFPIANQVIDEQHATQEFIQGVKAYKKGTYLAKISAVQHFLNSLKFKFRNNKALDNLILTYAELLPNAEDKYKARAVLYKFLKISKAKILRNPKVATGNALLYFYSDMSQTAYESIENYLRAGGKPTIKLFAYYLLIMSKSGHFDKMQKVAKRLLKIPNKTPLAYQSLAEYYLVNDNFEKAAQLIAEGAKKYQHSVPLLLQYANVARDRGNEKKLINILKLIKALGAEQSPVYYSMYLEHLGVIAAKHNQVNEAAKYFRLALTFYDSPSLRDKLSQLRLGGGAIGKNIILESKVRANQKIINKALAEGKLEFALLKAVETVDLAPDSITANLILAKLQRKRGYFDRAIKTLEVLHKKYPQNFEVLYQLSLSYLAAYRLIENKRLLASVMNSRFGHSFYYASALGRHYKKLDNVILAIKLLRRSIKLNPLYHPDYFELAQLYIDHKKFKKARIRLGEAMFLAPQNLEYKILYSDIYYELDGTDAAIGYLRNVLKEYPENPRVLGKIAIYYYRSGQIKAFERYKKKLDSLFQKDVNFYTFLFKMAKLEGENDKAINYGIKILQLSGGDVDILLDLGILYFNEHDYKNATSVFKDILERIPSYPKVHYYLALININQSKLDEAMKEADLEIEKNKKSELGYYVKAKINFIQKNYPVAIKFLEKAISLNSEYVDGLKLLALIKKKQNYLDQAKELYLRARAVDQSDAEIHKQLAEIYERTGQRALALDSYRVYLEINVNAPDRARIEAKMRLLR